MTVKNSINEILADIQRRVDDKILEPSNAALLTKLIQNADTLDEAIRIAELGTTYKRTGFHFNKCLEKQTNTINYFKKNNKLSFETNKNAITHKLIIGDNYPALLNLLIEYRNKIDVIYIDPPYGKDSMGEFAQTNYDNAISRDNLLSMLYPRLVLAKQLLSETGVIFCSIDDKNQAYVKGLFDDVFGECNFIANFIWKKKGTTTNVEGVTVSALNEYILCYKKNQNGIKKRVTSVEDRLYPFSDEEGNYRKTIIEKKNEGSYERKTMRFPILGQIPRRGKRWQIGEKKARLLETKNRFIIEDGVVKLKVYDFEDVDSSSAWPNLLTEYGTTDSGTQELKDIFNGENVFENPKPSMLIKHLFEITVASKENSVFLDFFAGSGTTGQALLELNKEDDGSRKFILCTNNEVTALNPNGIAYDVTSKRLKRIMTGECYDGTKDFKWLEDNKPFGDNLLVLDIENVSNRESVQGKTAFDVIDETLYGEKKKNTKDKIEWVCDNFEITQKKLEE